LTIFGAFLGYLYARTRSLTLVILLHAAFNAKTLLWIAIGAEPS
jgi:membrane protease YdiL (CAAX protease family)